MFCITITWALLLFKMCFFFFLIDFSGLKCSVYKVMSFATVISISGIWWILLNKQNVPIMSMPILSTWLITNSNFQLFSVCCDYRWAQEFSNSLRANHITSLECSLENGAYMSVLVCLGRAKSKNVPRGRDVRYKLEEPLSTVSSWVVSTDYELGQSLFSEFVGWLECWLTLSFLGFFPPLLPWVWLSLYTAGVHREHPLFWHVLI